MGDGKCHILAGGFSYLIQFALLLLVLSSLWYKRSIESPRRTVLIWQLDVFKQGTGAMALHLLNMLFARIIAGMATLDDECIWYFANILIDTMFGVINCYFLLQALERVSKKYGWTYFQNSGEYGEPVNYRLYFAQLVSWVLICVVSKLFIVVFLFLGIPALEAVGVGLFAPLRGYPNLELVVVMIVCPGVLNILQFWVQDSFLKMTHGYTQVSERLPSYSG